jgi:PPK2 family polyphosphate:nucleotide phosphotransferase
MVDDVASQLRLPRGPVGLRDSDAAERSLFDGGKKKAKRDLAELARLLAGAQERLYAQGRHGSRHRVLLVLQGMDTSGKSGVIKSCARRLDPQGTAVTSFRAPTADERAHDFLWRIHHAAPPAGMVGIFDRSHYEDVVVARVHELAPAVEIERRYAAINDFERQLVEDGTTIVKCFLHISRAKQRERLLERLDDPTKHWKFNPADIDERARWDDYQQAYERMLERCDTDAAPWYVIPSDRKWYRNWAVAKVLLERMEALAPKWPGADFDVDEQRRRLAES